MKGRKRSKKRGREDSYKTDDERKMLRGIKGVKEGDKER